MKKKRIKKPMFTFATKLPEVSESIIEFSQDWGKSKSDVATTFCKVGIALFKTNRQLFDDLSYDFRALISKN